MKPQTSAHTPEGVPIAPATDPEPRSLLRKPRLHTKPIQNNLLFIVMCAACVSLCVLGSPSSPWIIIKCYLNHLCLHVRPDRIAGHLNV